MARAASCRFGCARETISVGGEDPISGFVGILMLPDSEHSPTELSQASVGVTVSLLVLADLLSPPRRIGLRLGAMFRAAVPEATVDKYGKSRVGKNDIHRAGGSWDQPLLESESKSEAMQSGS
jgi:hypothetical protein